MARYIDAEKLLAELSNDITRHYFLCDLVDKISCQPIVDFKKEEYCTNLASDYPFLFECSSCGWSDDDTTTGDTNKYNYCPNCGKKIDTGDTNES